MRRLAAAMGLVLLAALTHGADAQIRTSTGDRVLDSVLGKINSQAKADPDGFIQQLSTRHNIPEQEIRQAQETHGLEPADIFMATALAQASHRPVLEVAGEYKKNEGRGWGAVARDLGIKPGSPEFHQMKSSARGSLDRVRAAAKAKQKHEREMKRQNEVQKKRDAQGRGRGK